MYVRFMIDLELTLDSGLTDLLTSYYFETETR